MIIFCLFLIGLYQFIDINLLLPGHDLCILLEITVLESIAGADQLRAHGLPFEFIVHWVVAGNLP